MKIITCTIAVKENQIEGVEKALSELNLGIYHFGTEVRDAKKYEEDEVQMMVPVEALNS